MQSLFISVIIPACDAKKSLPSAVAGIIAGGYGEFEIIIVDDASRERVADYLMPDPRVRIVRNDKNKGAAFSRNFGARISKGQVLFFVDADIYLRESALFMVNSALQNRYADAIIGQYDTASPHKDFFSNFYNLRLVNASRRLEGDYCHSAVYALRKELFEQMSGFNPGYAGASVEDLEFGRRFKAAGYKARVLDGLVAVHDRKFSFVTLVRNDFLRALERVELLLKPDAVKDLVKERRFDHHGAGQLSAILLAPLFWWVFVFGIFDRRAICLVTIPLLLYLNRRDMLFFRRQKGNIFYLKAAAFYLIDLGVIFTGLLAGLAASLIAGMRSCARILRYLRYVKFLFFKNASVEATFFVTNRCNAACGYCFYYRELNTAKQELTAEEIDRVFFSFGPLLRVLISGGEPFLRDDLAAVVNSICRNCRPLHITIPTNGILTGRITQAVEQMLLENPGTAFNITLNLAEIEEARDEITGVKSSFNSTLATYYKLKKMQIHFPGLVVGFNIAVTSGNASRAEKIYDFIRDTLKSDTIAFSLVRNSRLPDEEKAVSIDIYRRLIDKAVKDTPRLKFPFWKSFVKRRNMVYDYVMHSLTENKYILPCYAGKIRVVITPEGDVYPCETAMLVTPAEYKLGNLRDSGYSIKKIYGSLRKGEVCRYIQSSKCHCRHECDLLANITFNLPLVLKGWKNLIN